MQTADAVRAGQNRDRAEAMNALVASLAGVVGAAVDGDFSRRIDLEFQDVDLGDRKSVV